MQTKELVAGRELDALVAEKVMGLTNIGIQNSWCAAYSTDISAAWQVVEHMVANEYGFELWRPNTEGFSFSYEAKFYPGGVEFVGHADTAPEAICRAALKVVDG